MVTDNISIVHHWTVYIFNVSLLFFSLFFMFSTVPFHSVVLSSHCMSSVFYFSSPLSFPPLLHSLIVLYLAHKLSISARELCRAPFTNQFLLERRKGRRKEKKGRGLESFGGAVSKARAETPSLSKYYLRQQPPTTARGERGEERH